MNISFLWIKIRMLTSLGLLTYSFSWIKIRMLKETNSPIWVKYINICLMPISPALGARLRRHGIPPSGYCMGMCSMPIAPALAMGAPNQLDRLKNKINLIVISFFKLHILKNTIHMQKSKFPMKQINPFIFIIIF